MKKSNLIMIILLSIVPEIILGIYLQDVLNKGFLDTILFIYTIIISLGILRYIISEVSFRLFIKKSMIDNIYKILVDNKFPNPWNYYIDDGISYFNEAGRDVNNELLEILKKKGEKFAFSKQFLLKKETKKFISKITI